MSQISLSSSAENQARGEFLASFGRLQKAFLMAQAETQQQESRLLQDQVDVSAQLEQLAQATQDQLNPSHPLAQMCKQWLLNVCQIRQAWLESAQVFDKGTRLRQQQGDSLLVYVYGKVNAGKSSLGNHVATGCARPSERWVKHLSSNGLGFAVHETNGASAKQPLTQGFQVDRKECTSAVQYFTLPGLTWVDSPGLHSKTAINGKLARQYAQSADVVVYVMNAEHPARETDMHEIGELLAMGKPVVFVLTQADEEKISVTDGQLLSQRVMYSHEDRQSLEQYVMDTLTRHFGEHPGLKKTKVMSLSVKYAEGAETLEALEHSGVPQFMRTMQSYIEQESVRVKQETPRRNLAAFVKLLLGSTENMVEQQRSMYSELQKQREQVERRNQAMRQQLTLQLNEVIARAMQQYSGDNQSLSRQIAANLEQKVTQVVKTELEQQLTQMENGMATIINFDNSDVLPGFQHEYASFTYSDGLKKRAWSGAGVGAIGAGIGWFLGGPGGAWLGGVIGGYLGERAGNAFAKDSKQEIVVGDNRFEVEQEAYRVFEGRIAESIERSYRILMLETLDLLERNLNASGEVLEQFCQRWQPLTEPLDTRQTLSNAA
ncbi:dynamin family protein [Marinobacterium stanieri]|uniref:dynamin family protein n=1 Tax=Marinobacterium stanieri TaxID=49186 RepID=UPI003A8D3BAF